MKQDRFLTGILIGIAVLVVLALALFFLRQDQQTYRPDDTPEGVVHNYMLAVYNRDYEKAYAYLADKAYKPTFEQFRDAFVLNYVSPNNVGVEVGAAEIYQDTATVQVFTYYNPSDPFSSGSRSTDGASLVLQNGQWKIIQMPYYFWYYDWYQEPVKPVP
ncbi:MAG: hypothetical protein WHV44_07235 [Anaerolineales bacterium]